jgi:hypothetical protein
MVIQAGLSTITMRKQKLTLLLTRDRMTLFVVSKDWRKFQRVFQKFSRESSLMLADKSDFANGLCIFPETPEYHQQ